MDDKKIDISTFSSHLFWDVNKDKFDFIKHPEWIINRVLEYGLYQDWIILKNYYGIDKIAKISMNLRGLSKKSASFISAIADLPTEKFICYSMNQPHQNFWNS